MILEALIISLEHMETSGYVEAFPAALVVFCVGGRVPTQHKLLQKVTIVVLTLPQRLFDTAQFCFNPKPR